MPGSKHIVAAIALALGGFGTQLNAADFSATAGLRAAFLASNPTQARLDPKTGGVSGPAAGLARELARRIGVTVSFTAVANPQAVMDSIRSGAADTGFVAYDTGRARDVAFSQTYLLAWNTYLARQASPLLNVAEVDLPGVRIGVAQGDAGHLHLQRVLRHAELRPTPPGPIDVALKRLADGEIDAIAANRTRLPEAAAKNPALRVLPDNFLGVQQSIIVGRGEASRLAAVNRLIDDARGSELIRRAIERVSLKGVDVAPADDARRQTPG